eukprot:368118_1
MNTGDQSETEAALDISTDDAPEAQTTHEQQVVPYDEYDVVMCVWGFIRMYIECNKVIPEELKQLIMHFVGEYYVFLKRINHLEHQQIVLKIHSHKGHYEQYTPEKMLQSNDDLYITRCTTNDWI